MGHKRLRDDEGDDVRVPSDFPITCGSCLSPCVRKSWNKNAMIRRARLGLSQESSFIRAREMPSENIYTHPSGSLDDPVANAGNLVPPEDKSIKRLVLRGRNLRFLEDYIREKFVAYGEIESFTIRSLAEHGWACITYKTRQGAEKATQELSEWLVVRGEWLRLAWVPSSSDLPVVCDTCLWEPRLKMPEKEVARRPESVDRRIFIYQNETPSQQRERRRQGILSSPALAALLAKARPLTLKPPKDKSVRTLVVYGLDERVLEQDVRDQFVAYGEIQCVTIRFTDEIGCAWAWAFVTFTTRQGAEKASQALSDGLVINGQRVQVTWGMPESGDDRIYETPSQQRERHRQEFLSKADPLTLKPPEDKSIRTLLVRGLDSRILFLEQDLRGGFAAYGEIQSITIRPTCEIGWACAFVTFATREGAEKASQELSEGLVLLHGQRVHVTWRIPHVSEPDEDSSNHE